MDTHKTISAHLPGRGHEPHPFVKWVGGKRQLLDRISPYLPDEYGAYHEPFVGGGALYFHLSPEQAFLSDVNHRLVRTYRALKHDVGQVIARLRQHPHDRDYFLAMRQMDIDRCDDVEVAAWFIYLNRTAYNGLYRVNRHDRFNVPFGAYKNPHICDEENLLACSQVLQGAELGVEDFTAVLKRARKGDLVYFDPPYVPLSATSSFTSYTAGGFGPAEQEKLRDVARTLKRRGVHVLLSNSSACLVRSLYADGFQLHEVGASRSVNCKGSGRGRVVELLIR
jgi:DNA adenine methylase